MYLWECRLVRNYVIAVRKSPYQPALEGPSQGPGALIVEDTNIHSTAAASTSAPAGLALLFTRDEHDKIEKKDPTKTCNYGLCPLVSLWDCDKVR